MFTIAQASKTRIKASRLRALERRLQATPTVPVVVLRSSRRTTVFEICSRLAPDSTHVILWKGSPAFLEQIEERVRRAYDVIAVPGEGFVTETDAQAPALAHLKGAVVIIDIPGGATDTYQNVIDFARALKPSRLVAFHGADCELMPLDTLEPLTGRKTTSVVRPIPSAARRLEPEALVEPEVLVESGRPNVFWMRKVNAAAVVPQGGQQ